MTIQEARDRQEWDAFLTSQQFSPFLQSWTMGDVYNDIGQKPIRLEVKEGEKITGICFGHVVPARRGRHISIPYGPILNDQNALQPLLEELRRIGKNENCSFIRMSPFWPEQSPLAASLTSHTKSSPLHLLAEHLWYLPLKNSDPWNPSVPSETQGEDAIFKNMRSTARNLIRRAEKEGVTIETSKDPTKDLDHFIKLHDETRKRHGFTPYTHSFFRAQIAHFAPRGEATLYLAHYQGEVIAASIHMHLGGETSYHHGASTHRFSKIPASYLLQWTAIKDAIKRGDDIYNFWGIAPLDHSTSETGNLQTTNYKLQTRRHPFAGVTLFKTGFGGRLLNLMHCVDLPIGKKYYVTRLFEQVRKWKRGF